MFIFCREILLELSIIGMVFEAGSVVETCLLAFIACSVGCGWAPLLFKCAEGITSETQQSNLRTEDDEFYLCRSQVICSIFPAQPILRFDYP